MSMELINNKMQIHIHISKTNSVHPGLMQQLDQYDDIKGNNHT